MKTIITLSMLLAGIMQAQALAISEVMSNPIGDDSGREWIEVSNDTASDIDLSAMTVSIKGGSFAIVTPLQGGAVLPPGGYAIIASTVSGATKFLQDYPSYVGPLFRASMSLVNTGITSIDIKLNGTLIASLPSYTAAKEGQTLSFISGSYVTGNPTPGSDNQAADTGQNASNATTTDNQTTLPQMSPPLPDIVLYMPEEKVVVAGAESDFSAFAMTRANKPINDVQYTWAFGDGGQGTGSSTKYRYVYNGYYVAQVEALGPTMYGKGRTKVRVVSPDLVISSFGIGKYGSYVEITNPNTYDLDLSQWTLTLNGAGFPFPKNTLLPANSTTRFSGLAMGFASTTIASSTVIKILFPNLEEVTRYSPPLLEKKTETIVSLPNSTVKVVSHAQPKVLGISTTTKTTSATALVSKAQKDKRIAAWLKGLFGR